jgi:hypothetical protein
MIKVSKAPSVLFGYNILLLQAGLHINILYPEMCAAPFDPLIKLLNQEIIFKEKAANSPAGAVRFKNIAYALVTGIFA